MECRLQNRSWGMWRILPLKLSVGQDTSAQSSDLCCLIFTVFFAASWTSRSARASAVSLESPSKREIQGVGTSYKVILWPRIFQSVMLRGLEPPSQHRQNGIEVDNTPMTQGHSDAGFPLWALSRQRVANINPESQNHNHSEPSHFLNFPHRRFIETFSRMGASVHGKLYEPQYGL